MYSGAVTEGVFDVAWKCGNTPQEWREAIIVPAYLHEGLWSRVWHLQGLSPLSMVGKIYVRCFVTD